MRPRLDAWLAATALVLMAACSSGGGEMTVDAGSGGVSGSGGTLGTGGLVGGTGGSSSGGSTASGGLSGTGATVGSGGASTGGVTSSGGTAAGGKGGTIGNGGAASGGAAGGRPGSGGAAGRANGGTMATGGASVGGAGGAPAGTGGAGGQANLPAGVTALFPPPNGTSICPDPPLRLTFSGPPTLGTTGKITVSNAAGSVVATVDLAASTITDTIGGTSFVVLRPVFVDGNAAIIYLKTKALAYGQTYSVAVDAGAIKPPGGGTFSISGTTAWRFSTAAAAPANLSALTVALDGSGPFCTVQGATDALPTSGTTASTITIKSGTYHEIIHVRGKSNLTLHGQDRAQTIIAGTNNNAQQGTNGGTANRALVGFDAMTGLIIENLTIHNLTPQDGTQAEALRMQTCEKCVVRNADILSLQDTLLWSGHVYADNCLIVGNVDYIWGTGVAYFNKCELRTVGRTGVIVQSRNGTGAYGYVFVDCKLTADSKATNNILARIDVSAYPGSHVAYVNCQMTNIASGGWTITGGTAGSSLRFWEYQSTDASGTLLSTGGRVSASSQMTTAQVAIMRDPSMVLGGWSPPTN